MRNPGIWLAIAAAIGPLFLGGALFVPIAVALIGVQQQVTHKGGGVAPGLWIAGLAALILAVFIYPAHFDTVAKCDEISCNNLPFYTMRSF